MDQDGIGKDRVKGTANQIKGTVKEALSEITGDAKLQEEGKADKAKGKDQSATGGARNAARRR